MKDLIAEKIADLIEIAILEDEPNVQIILLALNGARMSGDDGILAKHIQQYLKEVLIPKIQIDSFMKQVEINDIIKKNK